jgi:hypothetical protein
MIGLITWVHTFSFVMKNDSIKVLLTLVVQYDREMHQFDIKTTFVNDILA